MCPFCYERFVISKILFRCENQNDSICPKENDAALARYFDASTYMAKRLVDPTKNTSKGILKTISGRLSPNRKTKCDQCNKETRIRVCPHCHNQLPQFFHEADSHIISVVGARNSGKTHFITVLINELIRNGVKLNISAIPQDVGVDRNQVTSQRYKREYKIPLIEQGRELPQTQENAKDHFPLIYQIRSGEQGPGHKVLYLVFYDTAGENFKDQQALKKIANYINNSSGIIFLLDTFQIDEVKRTLRKNNIKVSDFYTSFNDVLDQIISLFSGTKHMERLKDRIKIPIAVTFSKIDEVLKYKLFKNSLIPSDKAYETSSYLTNRKYSQEEIDQISNLISYSLENWGEEAFTKKINQHFSNVHYFGVSALGDSPVHGRLEEGTVKPHRVMDPLVWILSELNFVLPK